MEYKKIKLGSYNLHLIKTKRFRTVDVRIIFQDVIKKENITRVNLLLDLLTDSTKSYPTNREFGIKLENLYGADLRSFSQKYGKYINHCFNLSFLNEKYTEKGMFEESIKLLKEVIFNTNVTNKTFDATSFKINREANEAVIKSIKENPAKYSIIRLLENMDKKALYAYRLFGYLEDLEIITEHNLYDSYISFLNNSDIDIYVIGNIDFDKTTQLIKENFNFKTIKKEKENLFINHHKFRKVPVVVKETEDLKQSKLSIGFKISLLSDFEYKYVSTVYNSLLGNSSNSKLFTKVREENSLCYYISSTVYKGDNLLIINAGITKNNFKKTIGLVKKVIRELSKGNFTEEDMNKVKAEYTTALDDLLDSPNAIMEMYRVMQIMNYDDLDTRRAKIKEVTKKDILKFSKKIHLDTIFLLEGVNEDAEENTNS